MMTSLITILGFVGVIASLILLHELGHFLAARLFKIEVEEFGIGFPPHALTLFEAGGTKFTLNWLPLGGFVRPKGEDDPDVPGGLAAAKPIKRIIVLLAGPFMNLLAAVIIYAMIFAQSGIPDWTTVQVLEVAPNSPAEKAGLEAGDEITSVNDTSIENSAVLRDEIYAHLDEEVSLVFQRDDQAKEVSLVPRSNPPPNEGAIGIVMTSPLRDITWFEAIPMGAVATYGHSVAILTLPSQWIRGAEGVTRPQGFKGMYDGYEAAESQELIPEASQSVNIMAFVVAITVSLGVLNLFPIPALDGGRILFALPEIIFRRRVSQKVQNISNTIGFFLLISALIYINVLDIVAPVSLP
ncbi:MAG: Metalloprotease MmpA [Chloroflexi bacterium]|nr:Metalloprotease MmpA [Chloroflexota bacterium]